MKLFSILLFAFPALAFAQGEVPKPSDIASFHCEVCSSPYFKEWRVREKELNEILQTYKPVKQECWQRNYHHVAMNDQMGTVKLKDGTLIRWTARPGGLAMLRFPGGQTVFLAREAEGSRCAGS